VSAPAEAFAASLRQEGRATNEDAFLIRSGPPLVVALADGAGNAEQAARHALRRLERFLGEAGEEDLRVFANWAGWFRAIDAAKERGLPIPVPAYRPAPAGARG